jgi:hypothetical protein
VAPLSAGVDAIERGIEKRARRVVAPRWVDALLPIRMPVQRIIEEATWRGLEPVLETAREERAPLTTELPERQPSA